MLYKIIYFIIYMINYLKLLIGIILAPILFMIYDGVMFAYCLSPGTCVGKSIAIKQICLLCILLIISYKYSETLFYILLCFTIFMIMLPTLFILSPDYTAYYLEKMLKFLSYPLIFFLPNHQPVLSITN